MTKLETLNALKEALREGVAHFFYEKADGSEREAYGTTNTELIPVEESRGDVSSSRRATSSLTVAYWDLDSGGWRCFRPGSLISFDDDYGL